MLISKKDLLTETGISYGQLYRWKREGLIPEDWFVKQPSFTGQETFFPKVKILSRIKAIQELKDKYSLDELAKMLSPEVSERLFSDNDLNAIEEVEKGLIPLFCKVFGKETFSFIEVILIIAVSKCKRDYHLEYYDTENILNGIKDNIGSIKQTDFMFVLLDNKGEYFVTLHAENAQIFFDTRLEKLCQIRLNDISSMMKIKYRKSFNFKFDNEQDENKNPFEYPAGKVVQV